MHRFQAHDPSAGCGDDTVIESWAWVVPGEGMAEAVILVRRDHQRGPVLATLARATPRPLMFTAVSRAVSRRTPSTQFARDLSHGLRRSRRYTGPTATSPL